MSAVSTDAGQQKTLAQLEELGSVQPDLLVATFGHYARETSRISPSVVIDLINRTDLSQPQLEQMRTDCEVGIAFGESLRAGAKFADEYRMVHGHLGDILGFHSKPINQIRTLAD